MSDFNSQRFGFSTGALERGNYAKAVSWMQHHNIHSIELSALRYEELEPLVSHLDQIDLSHFHYISFHAPSSFSKEKESKVLEILTRIHKRRWNIIAHPDIIYTPNLWAVFGENLLVENMDRRKATGRTASELTSLFNLLPEARLCLDIAHARQLDTTLTSLLEIIQLHGQRVAEIHISELDSYCQHRPISDSAATAYKRLAGSFGETVHVIIESMLDRHRAELRIDEMKIAQYALRPSTHEF